jgi:sec-independent protein translocase protein TatA
MFHLPSFGMWLVLGILAVLFFGKRLPRVTRDVAGAIINFKKGLKDVQDDIFKL